MLNATLQERIDVKENFLYELDGHMLVILLKDRTTDKNIIWATNDYAHLGNNYSFHSGIEIESVTGDNGEVIKPRAEKSLEEQIHRIRTKAEVFTPAWICNAQNNLVDNAWFGRENVFNKEFDSCWQTNPQKIRFPKEKNKSWQDYVSASRLEVSCGEAPYLTSRYDAVSGFYIEPENRIGLLDRKLRVISENVDNKNEWLEWAKIAVENIYGYDWQGDNVFLSRENILFSVKEYYEYIFEESLPAKYMLDFARIISWNIWQMDGLKYVIPESCTPKEMCKGCLKNNPFLHSGIYCKIMDWEKEEPVLFVSMLGNGE